MLQIGGSSASDIAQIRLGIDATTCDVTDLVITQDRNVGIGTSNPQAKLDVAGKINCTVLELTSDRAQKSGFAPVDRLAILDQLAHLEITTWHYTNEPAVRHIGPMAREFKAAFKVGSDGKHIATVDADGVLFASLQGLNQKLESELQERDTRIAALEQMLTAQEQTFAARLNTLEKHFTTADEPVPRSRREEARFTSDFSMQNAE